MAIAKDAGSGHVEAVDEFAKRVFFSNLDCGAFFDAEAVKVWLSEARP